MMIKRTKYINDSQPVNIANNYYPVTNAIYLKDQKRRHTAMMVMTDRAEGGTSLNNGEIELMIQRLIKTDDARGMS